jgi:hypothetical protein
MIDIEATAADLRKEKLVDRGRLKPGGRKEVLDEIDKLERVRGLRVHVLLLPVGDSPVDAKPLWDKLGLDNKRDCCSCRRQRLEVRGWGLTRQKIDAAMAEAAPGFKQYLGKGVTQSLIALAAVAVSPTPPPPPSLPPKAEGVREAPARARGRRPLDFVERQRRRSRARDRLGIVGALVVGGVGFAIYRRNKRASESRGDFDTAKANAERAYPT